jgi:hypothetical protein
MRIIAAVHTAFAPGSVDGCPRIITNTNRTLCQGVVKLPTSVPGSGYLDHRFRVESGKESSQMEYLLMAGDFPVLGKLRVSVDKEPPASH